MISLALVSCHSSGPGFSSPPPLPTPTERPTVQPVREVTRIITREVDRAGVKQERAVKAIETAQEITTIAASEGLSPQSPEVATLTTSIETAADELSQSRDALQAAGAHIDELTAQTEMLEHTITERDAEVTLLRDKVQAAQAISEERNEALRKLNTLGPKLERYKAQARKRGLFLITGFLLVGWYVGLRLHPATRLFIP